MSFSYQTRRKKQSSIYSKDKFSEYLWIN